MRGAPVVQTKGETLPAARQPSEIDMDDDDHLLMDLSPDDLDALPTSMDVDL